MAPRRNDAQLRVITVHNDYLYPLVKRSFTRRLLRRLLSSFDHVVVVSEVIRRQLEEVVSVPMVVLPAYIEDQSRQVKAQNEVEIFPGDVPTLIVSAYEVDRMSTETDLYGLDVAAKVYAEMRSHRQLRLGIFIAKEPRSRRDRDYLDKIVGVAREASDPGEVRSFVGQPLGPVFSESALVYIRPSRTDGDAVSVREALAALTPVVASDVVPRPEGVRTAPIGDVAAWVEEIERLLAEPQSFKALSDDYTPPNLERSNSTEYVELYESWLREYRNAVA